MAELFNRAIEALCDLIEIRENPKIKVIKDISSSAVGHLYPAVGNDHDGRTHPVVAPFCKRWNPALIAE